VYTAIFAVAASFLMAWMDRKENFYNNTISLVKTYLISLLLIGFWAFPLIFNISYKTDFGYRWTVETLSTIFPQIYLPVILFLIIGLKIGAENKDRRISFLFSLMFLSVILYLASPLIGLVDVRFLPFMQFSGVLLAAFGLGTLIKALEPRFIALIFIGLLTMFWVNNNVSFTDTWIEWNYSGYESKNSWGQFNELNNFLRDLPYGVIFHEYSPSHSKFGTPRAFESFPMFTGKPVVEGLTIESGLLAPFTFYMQSELSKSPTCPIPGSKCSYFDVANGTRHLELFNIRYVVATSDKLKNSLNNITRYRELQSFKEISVYEVPERKNYVILPDFAPVAVITDDWRNASMNWFRNTDIIDVPLVFVEDTDKRFTQTIYGNDISGIERVRLDDDCIIEEKITNETIDIDTTCIGKPLLIRVPYFPDWSVEGADKIYLASPGFMLVFPSNNHVKLKYGSFANMIGYALTASGIVFILFYLSSSGFRRKFQSYGYTKNVKKHKRNV